MKIFFTLLLLTNLTWAQNPADRNDLNYFLNSALSEESKVREKYEQTEISKRYYQEQFKPSSRPQVIAIDDKETVTVGTRLNLEMKKSNSNPKIRRTIRELEDQWIERISEENTLE
jgi:hypothetical protein